MRAACEKLGRSEPSWGWCDSVGVARRAWPELKGNGGHRLASLKAYLGLQFEHHDAEEDARAAAEVVLLAERGLRGVSNEFDVVDDDDAGPSFLPMPTRTVAWPAAVQPSPVNAPAMPDPVAQSTGMEALFLVPVAADGSALGPELARNGRYTVGAKGSELKFDDFEDALKALHKMDTPRWRRPNVAGNWGIAPGLGWKALEKI
ncbi:hypothetical protein [Marivita sp. XM-24bin2]|uniref:hypothetical protein n=1 Tax=Marivita sp. XM-24bin2 TaxID=2133951 RepID=UPI0025C37780|nr:hypothetical protein [Marivita sp. XM-24bin2]